MYTILVILTLLLFWLACGFIAAGYYFAYFQRKYPDIREFVFNQDQRSAWVTVFCGVGSILDLITRSRFRSHGWLNPWGKKAKQEAGLI